MVFRVIIWVENNKVSYVCMIFENQHTQKIKEKRRLDWRHKNKKESKQFLFIDMAQQPND